MARWAGTVAWVAVASALEFRELEASVVWAVPEVGLQAKAVRELVPRNSDPDYVISCKHPSNSRLSRGVRKSI